jgi:hypothetical protein
MKGIFHCRTADSHLAAEKMMLPMLQCSAMLTPVLNKELYILWYKAEVANQAQPTSQSWLLLGLSQKLFVTSV